MMDPRFGLPDLYEAWLDADAQGDDEAIAILEAEIAARAARTQAPAIAWSPGVQDTDKRCAGDGLTAAF